MSSQQKITIQMHCQNLPGAEFEGRTQVRLGIQKGKEVIEDVPANVERVTFTFPLRVEKNPKTGRPNFLGPFAQGNPEERFIYLCWGERKDSDWDGFRRAKIHLKHLDWQALEKPLETGQPIEAFVNMTDDKGGPLCASVRENKIEWKI